MRAVLRARSERVLGDLNPLPFPTLIANCCGWVAYSFVTDVSGGRGDWSAAGLPSASSAVSCAESGAGWVMAMCFRVEHPAF